MYRILKTETASPIQGSQRQAFFVFARRDSDAAISFYLFASDALGFAAVTDAYSVSA